MKEYKYKINGMKFTVNVGKMHDHHVNVEVNGTPYTVEVDENIAPVIAKKAPEIKTAAPAPRTETGEKIIAKPQSAAQGAAAVKSPLPGTIMSITVKEGDTVNAGDTVCVLEAMKMENDVHTQHGGTVKKILVSVGDAVLEGNDLIIIE